MSDDKPSFSIPSDFILVRFEILGDLYSMNDHFNSYLDKVARNFKDTRGFDLWLRYIRIVYLQLKSSMNKEVAYKDIIELMNRVIMEDYILTDKEARNVTTKLNDFVYSIGLTDITQEKRDLSNIFGRL